MRMNAGWSSLKAIARMAPKSWCKSIFEKIGRQDGAALVETALSMVLVVTAMIGVIEMTMAFYTSNVIDLAAREASRWAAVRGQNSCQVLSTFPYCNYNVAKYGPSGTAYTAGGSGDPVEIFVEGLGYPGVGGMTASATWWTASQDTNGATQWTTACTSSPDANGQPCNGQGHMVTVTVTLAYPIQLPFIRNSFTMTSTSSMVINE